MEYATKKSFVESLIKVSRSIPDIDVISQYTIGRHKFDAAIIANSEIKFCFEFDGLLHYTSTNQILTDNKLNKESGYFIVRWPYWLQPRKETLAWAFKNHCDFNLLNFVDGLNYPHGFVQESCVLPADFCSMGFSRFMRELKSLPVCVSEQVIFNLQERSFRETLRQEAEVAKISLKIIDAHLKNT
jgi:hypothetical protein